jgi:hypothetical protein
MPHTVPGFGSPAGTGSSHFSVLIDAHAIVPLPHFPQAIPGVVELDGSPGGAVRTEQPPQAFLSSPGQYVDFLSVVQT